MYLFEKRPAKPVAYHIELALLLNSLSSFYIFIPGRVSDIEFANLFLLCRILRCSVASFAVQSDKNPICLLSPLISMLQGAYKGEFLPHSHVHRCSSCRENPSHIQRCSPYIENSLCVQRCSPYRENSSRVQRCCPCRENSLCVQRCSPSRENSSHVQRCSLGRPTFWDLDVEAAELLVSILMINILGFSCRSIVSQR